MKTSMTREQFFKSQHISATGKILRLLKDERIVTNVQLNKIAYRYGARLHELRREGHIIVTNHIRDGLWQYHYLGERGGPESPDFGYKQPKGREYDTGD